MTLLKSYLKVYGRKKCPKNVHPALRWGKPGEDDLQIDYDDDPSFVWKTPESTVKESSKATQSKGKKRKASDPEEGSHLHLDVIPPPAKKPRKTTTRTQMFRGLKWNSLTQTCAYDSILSIISNVYFHNAHHWQDSMGGVNTLLGEVVNSWAQALQYASFERMEMARDALQSRLNSENPHSFPKDGQHTDLAHLIMKLLRDDSGTQTKYTRRCAHCNRVEQPLVKCPTWSLSAREAQQSLTTEIKHRFNKISDQPCQTCSHTTVRETVTLNQDHPPPFIALSMEDRRHLGGTACQPKLTAQVSIGEKSTKITYKVRGLIYWDKSHFTCRMLGKAGEVYYNDGMTIGATCIHEGKLANLQDLYNTKGAQLTYIILSLV